MDRRRTERVARAEAGALKYWLGIPAVGGWERAGWSFSFALAFCRMVLLAAIATAKSLAFFAVGVGGNVLICLPSAWAAHVVIGSEPVGQYFALLMMVTQFVSLVSMMRAEGPDFASVAFGALRRRQRISFKDRLTRQVQDVAQSALTIEDDYRAAARYWYARRYVVAQLISYVVLCISLLSAFMTFAVAYVSKVNLLSLSEWRTAPALFLYYFQLGFDSSFFNLLDLAGLQLTTVRPAESFGLRLIRFSIYTLYLTRIVGYVSDVLQVSTEDARRTLEQRLRAQEGQS
jgi:hypothetical protein